MDYGDDCSESKKYDEFLNMLNDFKGLRIDTGRDDKQRIIETLERLQMTIIDLCSKLFNSSYTLKDTCDGCLKLLSKMEQMSEIFKDLGVKGENIDKFDRSKEFLQLFYHEIQSHLQQQQVM
ncbi:unnamed protein product [Trifolium pratense]|uniref:Uncharacterized protein n=1 Tax=Trifolium pratense TaxID=57577 RepID=A0ACB0IE61_TRIPR|nr:unnamed protein product [Trifolium pratense]